MSFPADGIEGTYKNNIEDVRVYLDAKHPDNYVVINISQRSYRTAKLNDRVCLLFVFCTQGTSFNHLIDGPISTLLLIPTL